MNTARLTERFLRVLGRIRHGANRLPPRLSRAFADFLETGFENVIPNVGEDEPL